MAPLPPLKLALLALLGTASLGAAADVQVYRVCASERVQSYTCSGLAKGNTEANCAKVVDSADCVRQIAGNSIDFGVLSPEEVLLASKFDRLNDATRVIAEIRHIERINEPFAFETVAIVKSDYSGLLQGLKGKNLCHPGFTGSQMWTNRVLKHFLNKVVPQTCNSRVPKVEEEYNNLASFFKSACIPGDWASSEYRDRQLKDKHPELCALCDNPERCSYNSQQYGSHEAALSCLTNNGGHVAYVALQYAQTYFGLKERKPLADPDQYRFLCPDGSMQLIKEAKPCTWLQQPWGAIVARREVATELRTKFKTWLRNEVTRGANKESWQDYLAEIVFSDRSKLVDPTPAITTLRDYVSKGRKDADVMASEGSQCRPSVRWCTTTPLEQEKCDVLRTGAHTYGLEPPIRCIAASSLYECMAAVKNMTADILAIDAEYSFLARQSFGLNGLIYQDTNNDQAYRILAVVLADSDIKQLSDLKKKSACFPEFGSLAWAAWVDVARSRKLLPRKCPSSAAVASYLLRACAPGADDSLHNPNSDSTTRTTLCALCPENKENPSAGKCAINSATNGYFAEKGAMRCLNDRQGDVAFVDLRALSEVNSTGSIKLNSDYINEKYRVLCRNGSISTQVGLLVNSDCALASGIVGEVVSRSPDEVLSKDAALLLLDLEYWFGFGAKHYESALNIFGEFKGVNDVIFKKSAVGFVSIFDRENQLAKDFAGMMERNQGCNLDGAGAAVSPTPALVLAVLSGAAILGLLR